MDAYQYGPYGRQQQSDNRAAPRILGATALLASVLAVAAVLFLPAGEQGGDAEGIRVPILGVSHLVYPSEVLRDLPQPTGETWSFPAASVEAGGAIFVLDSGNNRILKLDASGTVVDTLGDGPGEPTLNGAMAMTSDGERLYIANSLASQVIVAGLDGHSEKVLTLTKSPGDLKDPRPIGVAVAQSGQIVASDANNHRVLWLDGDGTVVRSAGTGARAGGPSGFNVPSGLTTDASGNVYVVDTLNGRVVELGPDGAYLRDFGKLGDTAGALARPKGVAVDEAGRVFVSDSLRAAVEVFGPDGSYLGMIGRKSADDAASGSILHAPGSLRLAGNDLYVTDRVGGLVTLRLSEPAAAAAQ